MNANIPNPFTCTYSPNFSEILQQLQATLVISTYQAGKVVFISAKDSESLIQLPRTFNKAMGIAISDDQQKMAIATQSEVVVCKNDLQLAEAYPNKEGVYDALFMPRATFYTGMVDMHDLHFGKDGKLWGINTVMSALCEIDAEFSYKPVWKPFFISDYAGEDRCHLNGLAMKEGIPKYATALGQGNTPKSWRQNISQTGVVLDIETNQIIAESLGMPHSPRLYDDGLYVALSAEERIIRIDPKTHEIETIAKIEGFVRGMTRIGDYLLVGKSKLRKNSSVFKELAIAQKADEAGIDMIHIPTGVVHAKLRYLASVDEIYDVQILTGVVRPNILNTYTDLHTKALTTPQTTYWGEI